MRWKIRWNQGDEKSFIKENDYGLGAGLLWSRIADGRLRPVRVEGNHGRVDWAARGFAADTVSVSYAA